MNPEHTLPGGKRRVPSVFRDICDREQNTQKKSRFSLQCSTKDSQSYVQSLALSDSLKIHRGCVNTISWNERGQYILSGSDDQTIAITDPFSGKKLVQHVTGHRANIFSAKFLPFSDDKGVVSCSGDGAVLHTDLAAPTTKMDDLHFFNCHNNTTYEVLTIPTEQHTFLSCGEDGTVRMFDLRQVSRCQKACCKENILVMNPSAVTAMCLSPAFSHYVAVGSSDSRLRIYDRRFLRGMSCGSTFKGYSVPVKCFTIPSAEKRPFRVTSVCYNATGDELLVNYSSEQLYLFDATKPGIDVSQSYEPPHSAAESSSTGMSGAAATRTTKPKRPRSSRRAVGTTGESIGGEGGSGSGVGGSTGSESLLPVRRLRLRGDWSDTGPDARPEGELNASAANVAQARPVLHGTIMNRMTWVISRMLADPRTRANLSLLNRLGHEAASSPLVHVAQFPSEVVVEGNGDQDTVAAASGSRDGTGIGSANATSSRLEPASRRNNFIDDSSDEDNVDDDDDDGDEVAVFSDEEEEEDEEAGIETADVESDGGRVTHRKRQARKRHEQDGDLNSSGGGGHLDPEAATAVGGVTLENCDYLLRQYTGHRNARTMIKEASFWGDDYIMSGSDCGHVFTWHKKTGKLAMLMEADQHVVNCVQPHPTLPYLATSGIDYDVKIWKPQFGRAADEGDGESSMYVGRFDQEKARKLVERNAIMLQETKDTITVPAAVMIRMLACIHSFRNRRNVFARIN